MPDNPLSALLAGLRPGEALACDVDAVDAARLLYAVAFKPEDRPRVTFRRAADGRLAVELATPEAARPHGFGVAAP